MAKFSIQTHIKAPLAIVFDLSRSIELHTLSTKRTNETAVAGTTTGLIELNETVTWRARHLFKYRLFTSKITGYKAPVYFKDEMQKGDFKTFSHEHLFEADRAGGTLMTDKVILEAPYGIIGKIAMALFLKDHIRKFLTERNTLIKHFAETEKWKNILKKND